MEKTKNNKWRLTSWNFLPNGNKDYEFWEDFEENRIEKFWYKSGQLSAIYHSDKNGNGWSKYFRLNGEIWFYIWKDGTFILQMLIGNQRNNETE